MDALKYDNIFEAITGDSTVAAELELKADIMIAIRDCIDDLKASENDILGLLGIEHETLAVLLKGKISDFTVGKLICYLKQLGGEVRVYSRKDTQ